MASSLVRRLKEGLGSAKGAENAHGEDMWLDNDDIRPLKLKDRTWSLWTYLTFWFSASEWPIS
jgi:NCS1 family nucleobase:cation symporter-1